MDDEIAMKKRTYMGRDKDNRRQSVSAYKVLYKTLFKGTIVLSVLLMLTPFVCPVASANMVDDYRLTARGAIVLDFETGEELYSHNADIIRPPASMTKMMTVYLVYEAISKGTISLDTVVPISSSVAQFSVNPNETNVPLSRSGTYTVDELLDVTIAISAGGATRALAELVGGTMRDFIKMMNDKVAEWELDAVFYNASGGSNSKMSPRAMATITRNTILEFPEVLEKTSKPTIEYKGQTYESTNLLFGSYRGIDGYKTGTNNAAGACFTGTAKRGDIRIIAVVMGSSWERRFKDTAALMDYGFKIMEERHRLLEEQAEAEAAEAARLAAEQAAIEEAAEEAARIAAQESADEAARVAAQQAAIEEAAAAAEIAAETEALRKANATAAAGIATRFHEAITSKRHFIEITSILIISVTVIISNTLKKKK